MRFTTWAEYGLIAAVHLARREPGALVSARGIADEERLPADYVEQIMLRLRRAGLVVSQRGVHGGYRLAAEPAAISVRDVIAATEQGTFDVNCDEHPVDGERCRADADCSIRPVWRELKRRIDDYLSQVTLADLARDETQVRATLVGGAGSQL